MRLFSCDMHDKMLVVHAELDCPLCKFIRSLDEEKERMKEALDCLETEALAAELHEVADKILSAMEKLRR